MRMIVFIQNDKKIVALKVFAFRATILFLSILNQYKDFSKKLLYFIFKFHILYRRNASKK